MKKSTTRAGALKQPIVAAGGVLRDEQGRIALVYRAKYGDWALPKGKCESDEGLLETALREVNEETGFEAVVERFADTVSYQTPDGFKIVAYWLMRAGNRTRDPDPNEVERIEWMLPRDAVHRLDHENERELVRRFCADRIDRARRGRSWLSRLPFVRRSARDVRLAAHLLAVRPEFEARLRAAGNDPSNPIPVVRELYDRAEEAHRRGATEEAWRSIAAAHRCEVAGMEAGRLRFEAASLRREAAHKLTGWRQQAVADLLLTDEKEWGGLPIDEQRERLARALQVRDERTANEYHRANLLGEQLTHLTVALLIIVLAILLSSLRWSVPLTAPDDAGVQSYTPLLWYAVLFGALGGCLSGAWSLTQAGKEKRFPEHMASWAGTAVRPLLGAGAGVAAFVLIGPGLAALPSAILASAFVAGFSERFILSAVASKEESPAKG